MKKLFKKLFYAFNYIIWIFLLSFYFLLMFTKNDVFLFLFIISAICYSIYGVLIFFKFINSYDLKEKKDNDQK
ncbi:hypothetical protein DS831_09060 [Bombilactobacillus bombi]|uniref:Uncharacterized protein n=1 Tax=Bombilactobacillus bombi TaxID=1303590 RepID=A0A417ZDJ5_9LACO|nr:hypothetical protein [Bombilactobacillus bombi]RHW49230.1 hypothetical protein DS831_09060 [Bombilactobacillus bombi]